MRDLRRGAACPRNAPVLFLSAILMAASLPAVSQNLQVQISREVTAAHVEQVRLDDLTAAQAISFFSGVLITSPEEYESLLRAAPTAEYIRKPGFHTCEQKLEILAQSLARSLSLWSTDRKAWEDIWRGHGLEHWVQKTSKENALLVSLAREVADEAKLARLYGFGKHDDPDGQQIRNQRRELNRLIRISLADIMDGDLLIAIPVARQTWQKRHALRAEQAYLLSSLACP